VAAFELPDENGAFGEVDIVGAEIAGFRKLGDYGDR
jgi:hypothetical protein